MKKIKIIKKIIINGDFNGKYQGKEISDLDNTNFLDYDINIFKAEVTNAVKKEYLDYISNDSISLKLKQLKDVKIGLVKSELESKYKFIEDLEDVVIYDIEFYDVTKDFNETYGAIRGKIYANISYEEEIDLIPLPPQKTSEIIKQKLWKTKGNVKFKLFPVLSKVFYVLLAICLIAIFKEYSLIFLALGLVVYYFRTIFVFLISFLFRSSYVIFVCLVLFGMFSFFTNSFENIDINDYDIEEVVDDKDYSEIISRPHTWRDNNNRIHSGVFKFRYGDYIDSKEYKERISYSTQNSLYRKIVDNDKSKLNMIFPVLDSIRNNNNYSKNDFADIIVSLVQNIPYSYNIETNCDDKSTLPEAYVDDIQSGVPCISYVRYDILTPLELFKNFLGDCDSRTVLLYTILKKYKFDVVILNSNLYSHSMLGLNIPTRGKYKLIKGKKYYFWETTAPGYKVGYLHPESQNISKWYLALK